jgi:tripartite-type tricarboxylate transporter receptor subunit TctC
MQPRKAISWKSLLIGATLALGLVPASHTAEYPDRPIKIVVGFAAGGPTDLIARVVAQELSASLGQAVTVENRPGGTASIATEAVASSPPDGHTLLFSSVQLLINPILDSAKSRDPFKAFAPVSNVASLPMVVITAPDSPLGSLQDIVKAAKSQPGAVSFGSSGNGSAPHLAAATLQVLTGTEMMNVTYRGNGPALTEVMAGRVNFMFYPSIGVAQHVASKRLKVLAVGTEEPDPSFPAVPTFRQAGFAELKTTSPWVGLLAPGKTPPDVVNKLAFQVRQALAKPSVRERLKGMGAEIVGSTPAEYRDFLKEDHAHWARIIKAAGVKPE